MGREFPLRTSSTSSLSLVDPNGSDLRRTASTLSMLGHKFKGLFVKLPKPPAADPKLPDKSPLPIALPPVKPTNRQLPVIEDGNEGGDGDAPLAMSPVVPTSSAHTATPPSGAPRRRLLSRKSSTALHDVAHQLRPRGHTILVSSHPCPPTTVYDDGSHSHSIYNTHKAEKVNAGIMSHFKLAKQLELYSLLSVKPQLYRLEHESDTDEFTDEEEEEGLDAYDPEEDEVLAIGEAQAQLIQTLTGRIELERFQELELRLLTALYGKCQGIVGRGAYGIVKIVLRLSPKDHSTTLFAVKELKRRTDEDIHHFLNRLTLEFCISSTLNHQNIVYTVDLMRDEANTILVVLPLCSGGDLYNLIMSTEQNGGGLDVLTAECFYKQLLRGIKYMHAHGIAHCDIKPENVLLTLRGCLKITDFGTACVFRTAWDRKVVYSQGACGSEPYVAPEEYTDLQYDPRLADVWLLGIVYMAMRTGSYLWHSAQLHDSMYAKYLQQVPQYAGGKCIQRGRFEPIEQILGGDLPRKRRRTLYKILQPDPRQRATAREVLKGEWMRSVSVCEAGYGR